MRRISQFAFRVNKDERRLIELLAQHLDRSQADAIRFVIRKAAQELALVENTTVPIIEPRQEVQNVIG